MTAVAAIINYKGEILIGKKKNSSGKFLAGEWHIPGETVEGNETDEEALIRGMKEETNLDITAGDYICSSTSPSSKSEVRWYECFAKADSAVAGSDLERVMWVPKSRVLSSCSQKAVSLWPQKVVDYFSH